MIWGRVQPKDRASRSVLTSWLCIFNLFNTSFFPQGVDYHCEDPNHNILVPLVASHCCGGKRCRNSNWSNDRLWQDNDVKWESKKTKYDVQGENHDHHGDVRSNDAGTSRHWNNCSSAPCCHKGSKWDFSRLKYFFQNFYAFHKIGIIWIQVRIQALRFEVITRDVDLIWR